MALDTNGRVYAWGFNNRGQCGVGHKNSIRVPVLVEDLREYEVDLIRCGYSMAYCRTVCDKHFVWGINDDNECCTFDADYDDDIQKFLYKDRHLPHRIDLVIKEKCDTNKIIDVYPGYYCLKIIVAWVCRYSDYYFFPFICLMPTNFVEHVVCYADIEMKWNDKKSEDYKLK